MSKKYLLLASVLLAPALAHAQGVPTVTQNQIWTVPQWNAFFASKADTLNGVLTNPTIAGGTFSGTFAGNATLNLGTGALTAGSGTLGTLTVGGTPVSPGFGVGNILGPLTNYQGSGLPAVQVPSRLIFYKPTPTPNDYALLQLTRSTGFTGGTSADINSVIVASTNANAGDGSYEWTTLSYCYSLAASGGQCVGVYGQAQRQGSGTDAIWSGVFDTGDTTDTASAGKGGTLGLEIDVQTNKADNATNGGMLGGAGNRVGIQVSGNSYNTGDVSATEISNAYWVNQNNAHVYFDSLYGAGLNTQARNVLDTRGVIAPTGATNPVGAVVMAAGQMVDFDGGASFTSAPGRALLYSTGSAALQYQVAGTTVFSVSDAGVLAVNGTAGVSCSGTPTASYAVVNGIVTHC